MLEVPCEFKIYTFHRKINWLLEINKVPSIYISPKLYLSRNFIESAKLTYPHAQNLMATVSIRYGLSPFVNPTNK